MPTKGQLTRHHIVATAAKIFNVHGYAGTSISHILDATGLEKGGLYRHFASKDDLALAAFDYALRLLRARHDTALAAAATPFERLIASIDVVAETVNRPALEGGCPILNTAVEADDTHRALRNRAAAAMRDWQQRVAATAADAIAAGQLRADMEPATIAAILTSTLEGAIMTTTLLRDRTQMTATATHLREWITGLRVVASERAL